jgi:hypothetical protein
MRVIATSIDVRLLHPPNGQIQWLGSFSRQVQDTIILSDVRSRESDEDANVLQKILVPAVVIGGIVIAVYLFFTVRS